jgi:copper homeostasis protein CutC
MHSARIDTGFGDIGFEDTEVDYMPADIAPADIGFEDIVVGRTAVDTEIADRVVRAAAGSAHTLDSNRTIHVLL